MRVPNGDLPSVRLSDEPKALQGALPELRVHRNVIRFVRPVMTDMQNAQDSLKEFQEARGEGLATICEICAAGAGCSILRRTWRDI